jgi:predicted metal-binding membrane protein
MSIDAAIESAVKRNRVIVLAALSTVVALSWAYLLPGAGMNMSAFEMTHMTAGGVGMDIQQPRSDATRSVSGEGTTEISMTERRSCGTARRPRLVHTAPERSDRQASP